MIDAGVLINFGRTSAFHLLKELYAGEAIVVEEVMEEALDQETSRALEEALDEGWMGRHRLTELEELSLFGKLSERLHRGEAAALAAAKAHGWRVAIDERVARRIAKEELGLTVIGTIGILVRAVRQGLCTVEEADRYLQLMIEKARYYSPVRSIREVLE